jgi:predicted MPP superfamily phosphohydrolase
MLFGIKVITCNHQGETKRLSYLREAREKMQLVQLSDIHVGSFFKQQVFDTVVQEVNKLKPDAI